MRWWGEGEGERKARESEAGRRAEVCKRAYARSHAEKEGEGLYFRRALSASCLASVARCLGIWHPNAETKAETYQIVVQEKAAKQAQRVWGAACAGQLDAVARMLDANADVEDLLNGRSALSVACKQGHVDVVRLLIENGADIESEDNDGRTPLRYACEQQRLAVIRVLIDSNADVNHATKEGGTPLYAQKAMLLHNAPSYPVPSATSRALPCTISASPFSHPTNPPHLLSLLCPLQ